MARIIERCVFDAVNSVSGGEQERRVVNHGMDHHPVPLVRPPPDNGQSAMSSSAVVTRGCMYGAVATPPPSPPSPPLLVPLALSLCRG